MEDMFIPDPSLKKWNDAAGSYAEAQERSVYADANKAIVKNRFKKLHGEMVLDLGCGYGYYTDYFRSVGGCAVGIDGAKAMIAIAKENYPESSFSVFDITQTLPFGPGSFDIVFCNQVLMDVDPIGHVFSECARILKPNGIFFFSIVHPAFFNGDWTCDENSGQIGKLVTSYLTSEVSENRFWGETTHFHRPLSCYLNAAADAGLSLAHIDEPRICTEKRKNADLPLFLFAEYIKRS